MRRVLVLLVLLIPLVLGQGTSAQSQPLTVFAAASLSDVMKAVDQAWIAEGHPGLRLSLAASSTLARQLEHGARANIFASADEAWMNWAAERHLIDEKSRRDVATNQLVLIVPREHARHIEIKQNFDIAGLLGPTGRLAIGDPAHVPAGRYAKQALTNLGVWDQVKKRTAPAESVRSALLLVERGEVPAGIVYATDAAASSRVTVAGTFPPSSHTPITYPFAVTRAGDNSDARSFMDFISGPKGQEIFVKFGFAAK
ncbi:MAG: molybdate ABC transporter substrate-binding protein [Acetobacteraceae bacterium]|nr:molybdate ABC transporter substrate-binding protein [Acetobacteraceae bacterium]